MLVLCVGNLDFHFPVSRTLCMDQVLTTSQYDMSLFLETL